MDLLWPSGPEMDSSFLTFPLTHATPATRASLVFSVYAPGMPLALSRVLSSRYPCGFFLHFIQVSFYSKANSSKGSSHAQSKQPSWSRCPFTRYCCSTFYNTYCNFIMCLFVYCLSSLLKCRNFVLFFFISPVPRTWYYWVNTYWIMAHTDRVTSKAMWV